MPTLGSLTYGSLIVTTVSCDVWA